MEDRRKTYTILSFIAILAAIVIYALVKNSAGGGSAGKVTTGAGASLTNAPSNDAERAALSNATIAVTNNQDDRVRMGTALPFPIPAAGSVELEAGRVMSARVTMSASERGTIEQLAPQEGKVWVMLEMEPSRKRSVLGKSVARAMDVAQPLILDGQGQYVEPVGLIYMDSGQRIVRVDPTSIVRGLSQAPRLDESRNDQTLWLVFLLPSGSEIKSFWLGRKQVVEWVPGVPVKETTP